MNLISNLLMKHPEVGAISAASGAVVPLIESVTLYAQCIAAVCGAVIGLYTIYLKVKRKKK